MSRFSTGRLFATLVLGVLLEPLGHAAAYVLRYGPSQAWQIQSQGGHAYFPRIFSLSVGSLLVAAVLAILTVISVRQILGHRPMPAAGLRETFVLLALTQCAMFVGKETMEALAIQATPDAISIGLLAVCVQLPLAGLAACVVHWMRGYLALAPEAVRVLLAIRLAPTVSARVLRSYPVPSRLAQVPAGRWYRRRGPPRFS
ncbi:MAG TPA: hypothetical protein VFR68_10580 [Candidatus Dormibacteraeota bacterium]|nr:hypothetical protein [Candidatus Dormibacteraeota bacterium]